MNPSNPYFQPSFTFLPQNPNPNLSYTQPRNLQPLPPKPFSASSTSLPDIHTTLSILKDLIDRSENTVNSISNLLYSGKPSNEDFCCCPFDYRHRMLPEFLFHHFLICPSSPCILNLSILDSLHYPKSFKSKDELQKENRFVQSLRESDADLCFSIDDYGDFGSNFFYRDCPGVVCSSDLDSTTRIFTLPSVLLIECSNFVCSGDRGSSDLPTEYMRILPTELCSMQSEIKVWSDYPDSYSYTVLRVSLGLHMVKESDLLKWVISNSPCYGIVIDVPMRDHIFMLLKLCLKAMSREAHNSYELIRNAISIEGNGDMNPKSLWFKCPILVEVMTWLASQLSVLFGEVNGKLFSVNMLKRCLVSAASCSLVFPLEEKKTGMGFTKEDFGNVVPVKLEESDEKCTMESSFHGGPVFVSQVAAAVAALHERSLLEKKIMGLRLASSCSKSQLLSEYSNMSTRAQEERRKRANYRPILEHDGLLWKRYHNQDSGKTKTREELLAEERDYKRRRTSYRGKKVKRSATEVTRDIIEEHMEEIKQAGGIGCFIKGSGESEVFAAGSVSYQCESAGDVLKNNGCDSSELSRGQRHDQSTRVYSNHNMSPKYEDSQNGHKNSGGDSRNSYKQQRRDSHGRHESLEDQQRSSKKNRHDREFRSRSPESYRGLGGSHERHRHRRERDEIDATRNKYDSGRSVSSRRSKHHDSRSFSSASNISSNYSEGKYDSMSDRKGRTHGRQRSESVTQNMTEDRYDPSESDNRYEDKSDKNLMPLLSASMPDLTNQTSLNDVRHHEEIPRN